MKINEKTVNQWTKDIHENAIKHGWWDAPRRFGEVVALCHSELSEALEEDRAGNPLYYEKDGKPEGVAVEMVDCMIRIMDYMGYLGVDVEEVMAKKHEYNKGREYRHGKNY